jgi:type IV pilus assembly protein PilZ
MPERTPENTRRHRRITVRILVDCISEKGMSSSYATTLGAGGLFIESEEPLECGTALKLRFRLPDGDELHELEGRVVWQSKPTVATAQFQAPGFGVKFSEGPATALLSRELEDCH